MRFAEVRVDHGLRYWQPQSQELKALTDELLSHDIIEPWRVSAYEIRQRRVITPIDPGDSPRYVARAGMSAIAKFLLQDFTPEQNLLTNHRAVRLQDQEKHWQIECEGKKMVNAKRCAIAIPAPQAVDLISTISTCLTAEDPGSENSDSDNLDSNNLDLERKNVLQTAIARLKAVTYFPRITVIAGYHNRYSNSMGQLDPNGWMVSDRVGTSTNWIGLDSSKRKPVGNVSTTTSSTHSTESSADPVIVIHSKASFAQQYLETSDLQPAAAVLLRANARKFAPWIAQPAWMQVHRWRYAQVNTPYAESTLAINDSLLCGGDWCVPSSDVNAAIPQNSMLQNIDYAYQSGIAMAMALGQLCTRCIVIGNALFPLPNPD